ncbi:MAG: hypothetical protein J7576_05040 [Siphonobacter aquaeclarae]|nr:hypothetical protein [Siphonobacter aquaeclarae]
MSLFVIPRTAPEPVTPEEPKNDTLVRRVNLQSYGYEKAEHHRGNALALENLLNQIRRGYIIDVDANEEQRQKQKTELEGRIIERQKNAEEVRTEMRQLTDTDVPRLEQELLQLDEEILQIRRDESEGNNRYYHLDRFKRNLYAVMTILLGVFIYLFYVSSFYSAFFRDLAAELQKANESGGNTAGILSAVFAREAFTMLDFHWAGPILLFAFGAMLHIAWEFEGKQKIAGVGLLLALILGTDGLLAYFIEHKSFELKVLMGLANAGEEAWWTSPVFYLVLAMGFAASMVWSGLLHAFMQEYGKKDVRRITGLEIRHRQNRKGDIRLVLADIRKKVITLEGTLKTLELDIVRLKDDRQTLFFSRAELEKYITDFYDGWLGYVNNRLHNAELQAECDTVIRTFYRNHLETNTPEPNAVAA